VPRLEHAPSRLDLVFLQKRAVPTCCYHQSRSAVHIPHPFASLPSIPGASGLGELERAGAKATCSRLGAALLMDLFCQVQPSSHPPACWVLSHWDGHLGTTWGHSAEQRWLWRWSACGARAPLCCQIRLEKA